MTLSPLSAAHLSFTPVPDQSPCSCYFCLSLPVFLRHTASAPFEKTSQTPLKHLKSKNTISVGAAASELLTLFKHHNTWSSKSAHTFSSPLRLHFIQARSNSLMNNGWMDRRLSSTMLLFLSLSLSCGKAIVLMQGNMHWRWAQGPPTQSVCLSAAWRISLTHDFSILYSSRLVCDNPDLYCNFPKSLIFIIVS